MLQSWSNQIMIAFQPRYPLWIFESILFVANVKYKMAVAAAAALLDELMGRSRNDGGAIKKKTVKWEDPEVRSTIIWSIYLIVNLSTISYVF